MMESHSGGMPGRVACLHEADGSFGAVAAIRKKKADIQSEGRGKKKKKKVGED